MAESRNLSNEDFFFVETLRDWRDPLLHGHPPLPVLLCQRCITCKCESLKDLHQSSCPNCHHSSRKQSTMNKSKRRANSHDPSLSKRNTSSSSLSKSAEHTPKKPPLPRSDYSPSSSLDDLYETDSLNEDLYRTPTAMSKNEEFANHPMNEQLLNKKKDKNTSKSKRRYRSDEGRSSKSKSTSNDLLSTSSSSSSASSLSIVPLRKKSSTQRISTSVQVPSSLSDDSLSEKPHSRSRKSAYLLRFPTRTRSFGLTKSSTYTWKNEEENIDYYPHYSVEQVLPNLNDPKRLLPIQSRSIILQRGQTDYWENCEVSPDAVITSSCENSTGSASHLLSSSTPRRRNSNGHIISITTTKRQQPSLLNRSKNTQWNVESDGKQLRYSRIQWQNDETKRLSDSQTDTGSSKSKPENLPVDKPAESTPSKVISYASTDEDVDELNSHYSDVLDRSNLLPSNSRHLRLFDEPIESHENTLPSLKISFTEYSQITLDSGVDIISEQKFHPPNRTFTIDEQSSGETTDQNDLFALSDDSLGDMQSRNPFVFHRNDLSNSIEQETFFSAKSELNTTQDPYGGYELETITDDDEDDDDQPMKDDANELIITSELSPPSPPPPPSFAIPPEFEFKLPSFGEWIDRVFTTFLSEANQTQPASISSSRSSSVVSIHGSQSTINTSSSSQVITVLENQNYHHSSEQSAQDDDQHSLNDMSSSSLNCDEKVDFDTYMINSNYEKINPSITNDETEILFINERSKSLLSSITSSSIENDDQEMMNNEEQMSNDNDDLLRINPFHSKDSALGLSDDQLNRIHEQQKITNNGEISNRYCDDNTRQKSTIMNEHDQSFGRTISSSSSEQLIPKEKQTGMYYKAFGSSAAIHLAEQYRCEWLPMEQSMASDESPLRIVHHHEHLGDNEDEFYFSPPRLIHSSSSSPNLNQSHSTDREFLYSSTSYSLTTLDAYTHLHITHETLEQIWLSLLDVAFSEKDDYELGEYKLRHIIGLSNSSTNLIEKSRSHNDIFSSLHKSNSKLTTKNKSKSFDITSLIKQPSSSTCIPNESLHLGLLQGADISEPFADRLISTSMHSDLESIQSFEPESIAHEMPSPSIVKEPLDYAFNYFPETHHEEFEFDIEDKPLEISVDFDVRQLPPPILPVQDTYMELSLFRPHSLSTIPSSRASQYASSVDSDEMFEREQPSIKGNDPYHASDDDHGVIGSEFSSPQSGPLSSIQSRPLSPEQIQVHHSIKSTNFGDIDHEAWERAIDEPVINNDDDSNHLTSMIAIEPIDLPLSLETTYLIDQIEPISFSNQNPSETVIEQIDDNRNHLVIEQDYITIEPQLETYFDPTELSHRLEQLDHAIIKPRRHPTQRLDKVSDLEIIKQGKGFKIGYADRQGTEPRIILTKRIEAGPDIMERDPQIRVPCKGRRILNHAFSSVLYTNGYNQLEEDRKFEHTTNEIEVPMIGTNPKHFDESDMVSIDIDGPSTMLNSICESIIITQGSVYSKPVEPIKKDKIEVIDSWQDRIVITGNSTPWRSPFKPPKSSSSQMIKPSTRDIALSPIPINYEQYSQTMDTLSSTIDRSCQYSPPTRHDQGLQCSFENLTAYESPGYLKTLIGPSITLERSADSGILVDDHHRLKSHLALQVDLKSLSSDSEDISDVTTQPINIYENPHLTSSTDELEQEITQLRRERAHVLDLLSLNWNRSNIWVELTESKLNYIIGETDALLRSLSFDPTPVDNEAIKMKMHQYEDDMAELTRQHLAIYRERLEDSKRQLDLKIDQLELQKSAIVNQNLLEEIPRFINLKHSKTFLSTSAENLTLTPREDTIASHPQLLDISFLTSKPANYQDILHRPIPRYSTKNLSTMEGLSQSQQAIIDETDALVKDSQQLHSESASQFERARESLLSSETSIRLARATMAATRSSERKSSLSKDATLAELFKYEQSLAKEAAKSTRHIYSTTDS